MRHQDRLKFIRNLRHQHRLKFILGDFIKNAQNRLYTNNVKLKGLYFYKGLYNKLFIFLKYFNIFKCFLLYM